MNKNYFIVTFFLLIGILPIAGNAINSKNNSLIFVSAEELKVTINKKDASNKDGDGNIEIKVSGGTAPYMISYFNPYEPPSHIKGEHLNLENLKSGEYLFVIQDNAGNTIAKEVKIDIR